MALEPGQRAPEFTLPADDGRTVSLADLRGTKVVLYFYPKDDTPGCTREACSFRDNLARVRAKGAVVYGVSKDSVNSHRTFKEKYGLTFPLLSDPDRDVLKAYDVWKEKKRFGRTSMGVERTTYIIDEDGRIARAFPRVKVDGHVDAVLASL